MKRAAVERRARRAGCLLAAGVLLCVLPCRGQTMSRKEADEAPSVVRIMGAPPSNAGEMLRRALAYAGQMHPTGLAALLGSPTATLARLEPAPELRRAAEQSALDGEGALPYHLEGRFTLDDDFGHRAGTVEADRYNDRWSRLTVTLGDERSSTVVRNGRRSTHNGIETLPFGLERLLTALLDPLGSVQTKKVAISAEQVEQDGEKLHCTVVAKQPPLDPGMTSTGRSMCVLPGTGDLVLDGNGYGFRTVYSGFQPVGRHRVPTSIRVLHNDAVTADLRLQVRVAGELTPDSFAETLPAESERGGQGRRDPAADAETGYRWMALPTQVRGDMQTVNVHMVPKDDSVFKTRVPVVVARVLVGTGGRVADVEVLSSATPLLRAQAVKVLHDTIFRRREWKDLPVSIEGVLILGAP